MLKINQLVKKYDDNLVLNGVSGDVEAGQVIVVIGLQVVGRVPYYGV